MDRILCRGNTAPMHSGANPFHVVSWARRPDQVRWEARSEASPVAQNLPSASPIVRPRARLLLKKNQAKSVKNLRHAPLPKPGASLKISKPSCNS